MSTFTVNLNDVCTFVLTRFGAERYCAYELKHLKPWDARLLAPGDACKMQLWDVLEVFGPHMYNGAAPFAKGNVLTFRRPEEPAADEAEGGE